MRFSAAVEGLCWGFPSIPGPGSSLLKWARYAHYSSAFHRANKSGPKAWAVNIEPALEHYQIQWPVAIWIVPMCTPGLWGNGQLETRWFYDDDKEFDYRHSVHITDCIDADYASALLWHELCHAAQNEALVRRGIPMAAKAKLREAGWPTKGSGWRHYAMSHFERDAYAAMDNHYSIGPLAVAC